MKKGDVIWLFSLAAFVAILITPVTHKMFVKFTTENAYMGGFTKFFILATMGELLAIRIVTSDWSIPKGLLYRAFVWGLLGMVIVLIFNVFAAGIAGALANGFLPGGNSKFAFAFFVSFIMNLSFAPTMMIFHRITDTFIDLKYENKKGKETWKGWVWCETPEEKCWVPYQIIEKQGERHGKLKEEYIATELNVDKVDSIEAEKELNGWVWGRNVNKNEYGWVPLEILEKEDR